MLTVPQELRWLRQRLFAKFERMLSRETLESYRRMTTSERLKLVLEMIREATPQLLEGPPDVVQRRFELLERQNNERNRRMLEAFAHTVKDK